MSKYFHIGHGLRGCYMPDSLAVIRVDTRKELKQYLEFEADYLRQADYVGLNKRNIAWLAAKCWKNRDKFTMDIVVPCRIKGQDSWSYGLFCSTASRSEYLEYQKGE